MLQTLICGTAFAVHLLWQPYRERSANRAQTALLACLVVVAQLNVPQAAIDTNALAESSKMRRLIEQLQHGVAVVPKSVTPQRITTNARLFDFALSEADMAALDGLEKGERTYWITVGCRDGGGFEQGVRCVSDV